MAVLRTGSAASNLGRVKTFSRMKPSLELVSSKRVVATMVDVESLVHKYEGSDVVNAFSSASESVRRSELETYARGNRNALDWWLAVNLSGVRGGTRSFSPKYSRTVTTLLLLGANADARDISGKSVMFEAIRASTIVSGLDARLRRELFFAFVDPDGKLFGDPVARSPISENPRAGRSCIEIVVENPDEFLEERLRVLKASGATVDDLFLSEVFPRALRHPPTTSSVLAARNVLASLRASRKVFPHDFDVNRTIVPHDAVTGEESAFSPKTNLLTLAILSKKISIVRYLLNRAGADPNLRPADYVSPPIYTAIDAKFEAAFPLLVEAGARLYEREKVFVTNPDDEYGVEEISATPFEYAKRTLGEFHQTTAALRVVEREEIARATATHFRRLTTGPPLDWRAFG